MKKLILLNSILLLACFVNAQKEDFAWIFGYDSGFGNLDVENTILNFEDNKAKFSYADMQLEFDLTSTCISDSSGNLLMYSNGCKILNTKPELIENGDTTTIFAYQDYCVDQGYYRNADGAIFLQRPSFLNEYYLLCE